MGGELAFFSTVERNTSFTTGHNSFLKKRDLWEGQNQPKGITGGKRFLLQKDHLQ
jgi:hypothetical protein